MNEIPAVAREPQGPEDTPEVLEEERLAAQHFIDTGMCLLSLYSTWYSLPVAIAEPLTPEELELKEKLTEEGFLDWSRRDFQQFVRGLEAHGWYVYMNLVWFIL